MSDIIRSYQPVVDEGCRLLILGTMPSVASLACGFFYGHPRNAFWPIMAALFDQPLPESIDQKRMLLLQNHVALWDVLDSCVRPGSLDADIRDARPNDFDAFFRDWPGIQAVLFNGSAAQSLFRRLCAGAEGGRPTVLLPSTSPARVLPFDQKLAAWRNAVREFGGKP